MKKIGVILSLILIALLLLNAIYNSKLDISQLDKLDPENVNITIKSFPSNELVYDKNELEFNKQMLSILRTANFQDTSIDENGLAYNVRIDNNRQSIDLLIQGDGLVSINDKRYIMELSKYDEIVKLIESRIDN